VIVVVAVVGDVVVVGGLPSPSPLNIAAAITITITATAAAAAASRRCNDVTVQDQEFDDAVWIANRHALRRRRRTSS